ncbi:MAG: hypothetical protein ACLFMX_02060 [Halobacteriales archaeon]
MPLADLQDALQYLVGGLVVYVVVALWLDLEIPLIGVGAFLLGIASFVVAGGHLLRDQSSNP